MSKKRQWKGNTGGGMLGQRLLIFFFRWWNLRIAYALMALVVPFYMLFSRKAYLSIYMYFRNQIGYSAWKSFLKTYQNHFIFGQIILDRFAIYAKKKDFFDVEVIGYEHYKHLENSSKGFIIAGSHVGNFEIAGYFLKAEKKPINAIVYAGETQTIQQNRSNVLQQNNIRLIPVFEDMSHLFAASIAIQDGEIVSMPCDRNHGSNKSVTCDFLNGRANFPTGAFALATSFDVEPIAVFVIKTSTTKYKIFVKPIITEAAPQSSKQEKIEAYVQSYVRELDNIVREYPEQWFNYYDFWLE